MRCGYFNCEMNVKIQCYSISELCRNGTRVFQSDDAMIIQSLVTLMASTDIILRLGPRQERFVV